MTQRGTSPLTGPDLLGTIRHHYDCLSLLYRFLWGVHIHHGYWEDNETPEVAQENLIRRLASRAGIPLGAHVLDVGCGLGGSSLWLARHLDCSVTGITLSPVQARMAARRARAENLADRARFQVMDANRLALPPDSFDAVWVIECSEHLSDKASFLASCARVLRLGGRLALCAWLTAARPGDPHQEQLVADVCRGMLCPSLASRDDYMRWMRLGGFEGIEAEDLTRRVERTWDLGIEIVRHSPLRFLLWFLGARVRAFVASFETIRRAYAEDAMAYGLFTGRKA
jgi:tocopherol O-methyltransferase